MNNAVTFPSPRRFDLDWLRILAILMVFVYHTTRFFDPKEWNIKNPTTYPGLLGGQAFLELWGMPFVFVISGASAYFALRKRPLSAGEKPAPQKGTLEGIVRFVKDRVLRLLVPLVVGIFTHIALVIYLERLSQGQFQGSFFAFYPHYFEGSYGMGGNFSWVGLHLWYLEVLFIFSVLFAPLLFWLRRGWGLRFLTGLGDALALPGASYLLAVPIILAVNLFDRNSLLGADILGWGLAAYAWFFLSGFVIMASERLQTSIQRLRWFWLGCAVVTAFFYLQTPDHRDLVVWFPLLAVLGFGMKHLNRNTRYLAYANQAVLPFYILHQTILVCVGYFVVRWPVPDPVKYVIIAAGSFALILGLYELLVRRFNLLRFLFGMKLQPSSRPPGRLTPSPEPGPV